MKPKIEVLSDLDAVVERGLELTLQSIQLAIAQRDRAALALAGGSTPQPLYEALAKQDLLWEKLHLFWGDERYVPPDHPESNQGMVRRAWLDQIAIPAANIHPIPTQAADPSEAAATYEHQLQTFFATASGEFPAFDLILLGTGPDAHTASLFPHTAALQVSDRLVTVGEKEGQPRITFTVPLINQARRVIFLVTGANKQTALEHIFASQGNPLDYPARLIQPQGELIWLLDTAAAALLRG